MSPDARRPTVTVVDDDPARADGAVVALDDLPAEPFALGSRRLVAYAELRDERDCAAALVALTRGVDLIVMLLVSDPQRSAFLDDLARFTDIVMPRAAASVQLTAEQIAVLRGLASGSPLTRVAMSLGMSRRTATRRLAEARQVLGAANTMEALAALDRLQSEE